MYTATTLGLIVSVVLLTGLALVAWRFRTRPGAKLFGVLQTLSAIWAILTIIGLRSPPGPERLRIWGLTTGLSLLVAALWLAFILDYTGRENLLRVRRFGVLGGPALLGAGLYPLAPTWAPLAGPVEQTTIAAGTVVRSGIGPIGGLLGVCVYSMFRLGLTIVVKTTLENSSIFVGQGIALALGSLVTIVASFLRIIGVPSPGYPITAVALSGQSLFWGYAVFGQRLLQSVPAIATTGARAVLDDLDDGIVVVDDDGVIVRSNPAARAHLNMDEIDGGAVDTVLERMAASTLADLPTRFQLRGRTYRATKSHVTNWRGGTIGRTVVIRDITSLVRRQQRLQVLNRVLRHNVRNDMNVVRGLGNRLQEEDTDDLSAVGATLEEKADDLLSVSEKAIELDRIFDRRRRVEPVEIEAVVGETVSPLLEQFPRATVRSEGATGEITTDPRIARLVLQEVLRNAVEHTGDAPEVIIETTNGAEHTEISITDDGPGIPRIETDSIAAGEETALRHASSLGLWLVHWGTQLLGGDVEFTAAEGGTTVTLLLPEMDGSGAGPVE